MKLALRILISILLLFNGIGALYGGGSLICYPDGSGIQLSLSWLAHTPFQNYLIPGIILFIANGLFSGFVLVALIFNFRGHAWLVMIQGAVLFGWIIIQILLIQTVYFLHFVMGGVGILLLLLGWRLRSVQGWVRLSASVPSGAK